MKPEGVRPQAAALLYLCVGLFGVQVVWGLQNANTSRVFQWLGADVGQLAVFWIAGPVTGALVQPIVGYLSDRTVGRWGRRRPYILVGAMMSALALVLFVNASTLPAAVAMLWFLGFSANVAMEPIRALTADLIPVQQQSRAYALQAAFIGGGAIVASVLPWLFGHFLGTAPIAGSSLPAEVRYAFYTGAALVAGSVGWMVFGTREHIAVSLPVAPADPVAEAGATAAGRRVAAGIAWAIAGLLGAWAAAWFHMRPEMYLLAFLAGGFGVGQASVGWLQQRGRAPSGLLEIIADILRLPVEMRQLAVVQFFTWLGLFVVWVYLVPAVAEQRFGISNPATREYQSAADWVGILFALYNAFAVLAAPLIARAGVRFGQRRTHSACLFLGALGFVAIQGVPPGQWPWLPALLTGIAWASILSLPYAIVARSAPPHQIGVHMGIHNLFLVAPQLVGSVVLGPLLDTWFGGHARAMPLLAAALFLAAACASFGRDRSC